MKKLLMLSFFIAVGSAFSQTQEEKKRISQSYDRVKITEIQKDIQQKELQKKEKLDTYFHLHQEAKSAFEKDGVFYKAMDILPNGQILYYRTFNQGSAKTIKASSLNTGGSLGLNINGENMTVGVWDEGIAMATHVEFPNNKIHSFDGTTTIIGHATHVSGTIVGAGKSPKLSVNNTGETFPEGYSKGLAYQARIEASDWDNDIDEMTQFAKGGGLVSNHSYGYAATDEMGNLIPKWQFGAYDDYSFDTDRAAYTMPKFQIVVASGNDRNDNDVVGSAGLGRIYQLTTGMADAKNSLTVGAVHELLNYAQPSDVQIAGFSNFGPTDDGRIKPNITAKGINVVSAYYDSPNEKDSYGISSGTSMATPAISAGAILLQQYYNQLNGKYMLSSTVRGLLQHTAWEAGASEGPDYQFGWGLADLEKAAVAISNSSLKKNALVGENILTSGEDYTMQIEVTGVSEPLIVSISWTDPPNNDYNKGTLNTIKKYLVNDLDVKVTAPDGKIYYPWKLDGTNPTAAATCNSTNDVDNFERVDIKNPELGIYTITVSNKGSLKRWTTGGYTSGTQDYTLIASGNIEYELPSVTQESVKIYPIPAKNTLNVSVGKSTDYSIFSITGGLMKAGRLQDGINVLDVSGLKKGIYILKLSKKETYKIVIE
ncbi:MAG: S8 family serine peptidase [Flavobacteriaceae bacterium]|nr:S8 family serine peptidase [Flavobacteriaceae bacterium]